MLRLDCQSDLFGVFETIRFTEIGQFFRQLVNLESLDLGGDRYEWLDKLKSAHNSALASSLHHITSAVSLSTPQPLLDFTSFPTLRSLHVTAYDSHYVAFNTSGCSSLPLLTHLTVSGHFADDQSIASLCILCPSLTHLSLYAFDAIYVDLLRALPATLSRLELGTIDRDGDIGGGTGAEDCSLELSRFILLQHLFLDDDLFSSTLPSSLANLQHLETLTLVGDQIFYVGLLELLSTPTRPPSLRVVELRIDCIRTGSRVEVDESGRSIGSYEPGENDWQVSRDWTWPEYVDMGKMHDLEETYGVKMHDLEETCGVRQVAEESGVQVRGNFFEALERVNIYYLELANIAIYRCFRYKTFGPFYELQDQALFDARLPPLDLDSLDPKNLKLVKTDLPDEGWFALSLENGD